MMLPNRQSAIVPEKKLKEYLLSDTHAVGKAKAKFFRMLGFDDENLDLLANRLIDIANSEVVNQRISSKHGTKFVITGSLKTPLGRSVRIKTIWIINQGKSAPVFVTAYPD